MREESMKSKGECVQCGKPFHVPRTAKHKRFCSGVCRSVWHTKERKQALEEKHNRDRAQARED